MFIYIYIYICVHKAETDIYIYICVCICIYIYIYLFIYYIYYIYIIYILTFYTNIQRHSTNYVFVTIGKAANKFTFICNKFYISKLLAEVGLSNSKSKTYSEVAHSIDEIVAANINYCQKFDLKILKLDNILPIMYWLPKMHKTPTSSRFIVASKNYSSNPFSDTISKTFEMIFNAVESFFYSGFKKFWVLQKSFAIVTKINKVSVKKKIKSISTFDFSTLYTTIPRKLLLIVFPNVFSLAFKSEVREHIGFPKALIIRILRELEEDISQKKLLTIPYLFS